MKVTEQKNDDLTAVLTVAVDQDDYQSKVDESLSRQAKNAQVKGFRQGKVPKGMVKKMYGNAILADEVNRIVNQGINNFLQENDVEILGQPLPVESDVNLDINNPENYTFQYRIGLKPNADISYLDKKPTYTQYEIAIDDELIDKEVEHIRAQFGEVSHPEGQPEGKDAIEVNLRELDDEGNVKEGGYEHTTAFGFDQLKLKKDQTAIGKLNVGDTYSPFNIYRAFDKSKEEVAKQVLELSPDQMDEVGDAFELKLVQINRVETATLDQEFYDKVYGEGNVTSEEEMRNKIRENLGQYFSQATDNQLKNDLYTDLMEQATIALPEAFLQDWLLASRDSENISQEDIEKEFPEFAKNLRSSLIFNTVAEQGGVTVDYDELQEKVRENLINTFKQYGMPLEGNDEMLDGMMQRVMSDEKQLRQTQDQLMDDKIFEYLKQNVKLEPKEVTLEQFNDLNKEKTDEKTQ